MTVETSTAVVEAMLRDFSRCSSTLGGLEFYGTSIEFRDLIQVCRDFAGTHGQRKGSDLTYLFIERFHGKSTMAKAIETEAKSGGLAVFSFDGTIGSTQKSLRDLQSKTGALTIVDGLPEPAANRRTLLERFNSLGGKGLLLSPPEYCADASLDSDIPRLRLDHVDQRPIDKLAWLLGLVRESLRDAGLGSEDILSLIHI